MKKNRALENIVHSSKLYLKHNASTVLTAIGVFGVVATSILTAKATIKAFEIVNEKECEKILKFQAFNDLFILVFYLDSIVCFF